MDWLTGRRADGADWVGLGSGFGDAIKTFGAVLQKGLDLAKVACCARLDEWDIACHAHAIDVSAGV